MYPERNFFFSELEGAYKDVWWENEVFVLLSGKDENADIVSWLLDALFSDLNFENTSTDQVLIHICIHILDNLLQC